MDDNRINELMNLNWKKMSVILDTELPVKRNKRRLMWLFIFFLIPFMAGLGTYIFTQSEKYSQPKDMHDKNIPITQITENEPIAIDNKSVNSLNLSRNTSYNFTNRIISENKNANGNNEIRYSKAASISPEYTKNLSFESFGIDNQHEKENTSSNVEENKRLILNTVYLNKDIKLISNSNNIISPDRIFPQVKHTFALQFGLTGSALFNRLRSPSAYSGGIFVQIPVTGKLFFETNLNYLKYNQYQIFQHNGNVSEYNSSGTSASAPLPSKFVYINYPGALTNNELDGLNESLLYSSISSVSYCKADINLGYHISRKVSIISGIGIQRHLKSGYEINEQNQALYKAINKVGLSPELLKSGDELMRKWITTASLALDYKLTSNLGLRYSLHMASLKYNSTFEQSNLKDMTAATGVTVKSLIPETQPEKGNIFFELGLNYRFK